MAKINRNDPCPCGSGKKYKKCCGLKALEQKKRHFTHMQGKSPFHVQAPTASKSLANHVFKLVGSTFSSPKTKQPETPEAPHQGPLPTYRSLEELIGLEGKNTTQPSQPENKEPQ
jgi:hypothetical protein